MPTALITGASRGIGLEFVRQYAAEGWRVHAACRDPGAAGPAFADIAGEVHLHALDVRDTARIRALAEVLEGEALDLLVNNAGINPDPRRPLGQLDRDQWLEVLAVNAIAPTLIAEAFVPHVAQSGQRCIVGITSQLGSIGDNRSGGRYAYRSSKAALNMAFRSLARDLAPRGITVALLHPGHVETDMGGGEAPVPVADSVAGMRRVIAGLAPADSGGFWNFRGAVLPW